MKCSHGHLGLPTCLVTFPARIQEGFGEGVADCMIFSRHCSRRLYCTNAKGKKRKEKKRLHLHLSSELFFSLGLILLFIEHFEFFEISSTPIWQTHLVFWGQASAKCVLELTGMSLTHTAFLHLGTVSPSPDLENCGFHPVLLLEL